MAERLNRTLAERTRSIINHMQVDNTRRWLSCTHASLRRLDRRPYPTSKMILKRQEGKTDEEEKDCIADKLQPDQNVIDGNLRQCIDESERDDRAMRNDQRSIKVLVMEHTNDKTQYDERVQTGSTRVSRVMTPTQTVKSYCKAYDRAQRRSVYQSDVISAMEGGGQKQSINQYNKIAKDGGERCM